MSSIPHVQMPSLLQAAQAPKRGEAAAAAAAYPGSVPDLCAAYNWPTGLAGGGVIAIVELGGGWVQSDIDAFFQSINQPTPSDHRRLRGRHAEHARTEVGSADDADYEVALDIEVAGASYYAATGKTGHHPRLLVAGHRRRCAEGNRRRMRCVHHLVGRGRSQLGHHRRAADGVGTPRRRRPRAWWCLPRRETTTRATADRRPANVDVPSSCPHVVGCGGTNKTATDGNGVERQPRPDRRRGNGRRLLDDLSRAGVSDWRAAAPADTNAAPAGWFPTCARMQTPTPATRSSCTDHRRWWAAPARWRRSTRGCLRRLEPSWGL